MKSRNKTDQQIIKSLNELPEVKDSQTKEELYQRISSKTKGETASKKSKRNALIPVASTVFAIMLVVVMLPSLLNNNMNDTGGEESTDRAFDTSSSDESMENNENSTMESYEGEEEGSSADLDQAEPEISLLDKQPEHYVVHEPNEAYTIIHVAVADNQAQYVIPLSIMAPKTDDLEVYYNELDNYLNEHEWGISEYKFDNVTFEIEQSNDQVVMDFPAGFSIGEGSANPNLFEDSLSRMFRPYQIDKILFTTEESPGVDLGPIGNLEEMPIESSENEIYKVYNASAEKRDFLIPIIQQDPLTLEEAFQEMKNDEEEFSVYKSIPEDINFSTQMNESQLVIRFTDETELINDQVTLNMVDAVLMTAKSYGYDTVVFENTTLDSIGVYELSKPIDVPLSVNPIYITPSQ
ncbi:hypothetical protein ACFQ3N_13995 [Virgibacillus byunsanensis]|uniref:Negative regulator of sigma-X activity n=1 Tax=Virgibacillus byunsanensis TaxID=570945 RepID=A0ABW3LMC3_9BACI